MLCSVKIKRELLGPAAGGWLVSKIGFQWTTTLVAGIAILTVRKQQLCIYGMAVDPP